MMSASGLPAAPVPALTELRLIVGTAALLAVAAVLALAIGAILRRSAAAVTAGIAMFLVVVVLGLTAIGTLLVWSATQPGLLAAGQDPRTYLKKQLLNVAIGLVLMIGVSLVDTRQLRTWSPFFYGGTVVALLAVLTPLGSVVNGARAWYSLPGGFQVEPNEFAKIALILITATVFSQARPSASGGPRVRALLLALGCAAPLIGLVVVEPALGVALVLVVVTATMIVLSGLRLRIIATLTAVVAVTIAAAAPKNLVHLVVQNGTYEANGSHPIPNTKVEFAAMARAAGYAHVHEFSELANFEQQAAHVLKQDGPVFATLHVERSKPLTYDYANLYDPARRVALKAALRAS